MTQIRIGESGSFPSVSKVGEQASALRFEIFPDEKPDSVKLDFTFAVMPINFIRSDGKQTGYSVGCLEAHARLSVTGGRLTLEPAAEESLLFQGTVESSKDAGAEFRPKGELKAGTEGAGIGLEIGAFTGKKTDLRRATAIGPTDAPRLKCIQMDNGSTAHWIMSVSPVLPDPPPLRHSAALSGECRWSGSRSGEVAVYGRPYVYCVGLRKIPKHRELLAKFFHYLQGLKVYDNMLPEPFEIVKAAG